VEKEAYFTCYDAGAADGSPADSLAAARSFLLPGILHYVKNVFTRYQLLLEVLQHDGAKKPEVSKGSAERTALAALLSETADSYDSELAPFIELLHSLYQDGRYLAEKFPCHVLGEHTQSDRPLAQMALSILRNAASFAKAELVGDPKVFTLSDQCWFRFFGPLAGLIAMILRTAGCVSMRVEQAEREAERQSGIALFLRRAETAPQDYRRLESAAANEEFAFPRPQSAEAVPSCSAVFCRLTSSKGELRFELFTGPSVMEP
jgi:hypothetical protein